ncbi:MAG: two-component system response regulator [Ktedonobacterales bacterium]
MPYDADTTSASPRVLVICREPNLRSLLAEVLAFAGYPVQKVYDGEEGWRLLQEATAGCLVVMQLDPYPDMWELMQRLHKNRQLRARHRIIQLDIQYYLDLARPLEPDDVLLLPLTGQQLAEVVERNWAALGYSIPPFTN